MKITDSLGDIRKFLTRKKVKLYPGYVLGQKYVIEKQIAKGGMGKIYKAKDVLTSETVCVKQIIGYEFNDEKMARFEQEYAFIKNIDHPNIVKMLDFFQEDGEPFLVMEFIEGIALNDYIKKSPRTLSILEQLVLAIQITRAIEVLNLSGILHRDIKPANIIFQDKTNTIKLLDLGLAKSLQTNSHDITVKGDIIGTPEYLSPEQVTGTFAENSDIFSLGVTLYQFFLWSPFSPFKERKNIVSIMKNVVEMKLPELQTYKDIFPSCKNALALSRFIADCLEKKPESRIQNASIAREKLEKIYYDFLEAEQKEIDKNISDIDQASLTEKIKQFFRSTDNAKDIRDFSSEDQIFYIDGKFVIKKRKQVPKKTSERKKELSYRKADKLFDTEFDDILDSYDDLEKHKNTLLQKQNVQKAILLVFFFFIMTFVCYILLKK